MKHLLTVIIAAFALASCTLETSDNGDFDGFWHLVSVDTLATGGTANYRDKQVFWAFQAKLYNMREYTTGKAVVGHFQRQGDSLFITDVYENDRMEDDPAITDVADLKIYGVNALCEHFSIVSLSGGKMTLQSNTLKLSFKKQ